VRAVGLLLFLLVVDLAVLIIVRVVVVRGDDARTILYVRIGILRLGVTQRQPCGRTVLWCGCCGEGQHHRA